VCAASECRISDSARSPEEDSGVFENAEEVGEREAERVLRSEVIDPLGREVNGMGFL
jgi:hypothetical protein